MREQQIEVLQTVYEYMTRFRKGTKDLATTLKMRVTAKEREMITDVIDGMMWILDALKLTAATHNINADSIRPLLEEMSMAIENDDMILLADLLEYELVVMIKEWEADIEEALR